MKLYAPLLLPLVELEEALLPEALKVILKREKGVAKKHTTTSDPEHYRVVVGKGGKKKEVRRKKPRGATVKQFSSITRSKSKRKGASVYTQQTKPSIRKIHHNYEPNK